MKRLLSAVFVLLLTACGGIYDASEEIDSILSPQKTSHPKRTEKKTDSDDSDREDSEDER